MARLASNQLILNFHDAILYESDVDLLQSEFEWLNDACIHFYLTVLQQRYPQIKFMDPSVVTYLMHQSDKEDLAEFSKSLEDSYSVYMIPINDGHATPSLWQHVGGGTHWSLLVVTVATGVCLHIDSVKGRNQLVAQKVADKIVAKVLCHHNELVSVKEVLTPQQLNGYDCGIHALAAAELLADAECRSIDTYEEMLKRSSLAQPGFGRGMRQRIMTLIHELKQTS